MTDKCLAKHHYLKKYRNKVWELLDNYYALNFTIVLKDQNSEADTLSWKGSRFDPIHH